MRFRSLAPNSLTLDDLERPKRPARRNKQKFGAHQKNFNEHRPMLSSAKCRPAIVVSKNIRYFMHADVPSLITARCYVKRGYIISYHTNGHTMSCVRLYDIHTGWNTSKIIARPNSLVSLLSLTPTGAVWCNGNTPKMRVEYG